MLYKDHIYLFKHIIKWMVISSSIGVVGSLSAIIITKLIEIFSSTSHNIFIIPFAMEFAGYVVDKYGDLKGSGVDRTLRAFNEKISLNPFIGFLKVVLSGIIIGLGGSAGKVGPSIQPSASFADFLYRIFKLKNRKALLISGIAGGLSGDLCAPFGSAIFAAEIVRREGFEYISCFPAILSSIFGYMVYLTIYGKIKLFDIPCHYNFSPMDFPYIFICAIFCAFIAYIYIHSYISTRDFFDDLKYPQYVKSFIGGILVAIIGYYIPQSLGLGVGITENIMLLKYGVISLVLILFGKIYATSFTVGTGTPGGLVLPSVFIGACSGALFGMLLGFHNVLPFIVVGIATLLSSMANVPLASAVLCIEIFGFDFAIPAAIGALMGFQLVRWKTIYEYIKF